MTRKMVSTKNMSREDWLALRKQSIGGSDSGAVYGMNDWKSPLEVYAEKKGMIQDKETNEAMRLGSDLEEYVAQRFAEATGKKVRRTNFMYQHDDYDFITANIDREVVGENAGLECKTMSPFSKYNVAEGEIPAQYYCQCQHYMAVMGYEYMYIAILVYGRGFYWHKIDRNNDFIADLIHDEIDFWQNNVMAGVPPEADGSESALNTLYEMYPYDNGAETYIDREEDIRRYREVSQLIKKLEGDRDELKASICSQLKECSAGSSENFMVTWKSQKKTSVDSKLLQAEYPEVYDKVKKTTEFRVMRVKELKKKEK